MSRERLLHPRRRGRPAGVLVLLLAALAGVVLARWSLEPGRSADAPEAVTSPATSSVMPAPGPVAGSALEALAGLPVKGRAAMTGYDRQLFGPAWADVDRNGCDTRNDVLARDLTDRVMRDGTKGCVVVAGNLADPYGGVVVPFRKKDAASVQIDHVVALTNAWVSGAQAWDNERLREFANDPGNLLATQGRLNQQKGSGDAATWLPPNKPFRCAYVARQVAVKAAYGLWMTPPERDAVARVLAGCPSEPLPPVVGPAD